MKKAKTMNDYSIALFLHVVGALGFFMALGLEWTSLCQIRNAKASEQIRLLMRVSNSAHRLGMVSMLTILITGFYLMAIAWGAGGSSQLSLVLVIVLGMALTGPRMTDIVRALGNEKGPVSPNLHALANHPFLWISVQTRVAIALGMVFLMTVKPGWGGSLLTIAIAVILGLASALSILRRVRVQEGQAD
jgi:hypothetical protein